MMLKDYKGKMKESEKGTDGIWKFHKKRIWIPITYIILRKAHKTKYMIRGINV
ncbi:hypothetical protein HanIR_Chr05g0217491 [Helianthus annuus]|nr:hypothetical protein HanIR_Chr05g0217491 [Helianthus annuus]